MFSKSFNSDMENRLFSKTNGLVHHIQSKIQLAYIYLIFFLIKTMKSDITGKSLSEALILASTNPQYDKRLFIEL
jgi:hypothetical protein